MRQTCGMICTEPEDFFFHRGEVGKVPTTCLIINRRTRLLCCLIPHPPHIVFHMRDPAVCRCLSNGVTLCATVGVAQLPFLAFARRRVHKMRPKDPPSRVLRKDPQRFRPVHVSRLRHVIRAVMDKQVLHYFSCFGAGMTYKKK